MNKSLLSLLLIALFAAFSADAFALNSYTTKLPGAWSVKNNWNPADQSPGQYDTAYITMNMILDVDVTVQTIIFSGNTTIDLNGRTLTILGLVKGAGSFKGSSTSSLIIQGTGSLGTVYFTSGSEILNNLTLNRTSGLITLGSNLTIGGTLTLTNGILVTGSNKITLGTGLTSTGTFSPVTPTSSSYINGNFERWISTSMTSDIYYPLGSNSYYRPAIIKYNTAPTTGGRLLVSEYDANPGTLNTTALIDAGSYSIDRYSSEVYWKFTTSEITGGTYSISLGAYGISGVSSISNYWNRLRIIKRPDSASLWSLNGNHVAATGSNVLPLVKRDGLTGFSEFGIAGYSADGNTLNNSPLPVTLESFNSYVTGNAVKLVWTTSSEINSRGFDVERNSGSGWAKIGFADSKGGINTTANYSFEDKNLQTGKYNYRLKQLDYNGNYEYFTLAGYAEIGTPSKIILGQNYPNPFNPATTINFSLPEKSKVSLKVYDISGKEAAILVNDTREAGYYSVMFRTEGLSSGTYFYTLKTGNNAVTKRMTVIK